MTKNGPLKSARHHWWPECVSKHWAGTDGKVGWLKPDGSSLRLPPRHLGVIGNGHFVKLGSDGQQTPFDESFESEFDKADTLFPSFIEWLGHLQRVAGKEGTAHGRFVPMTATDKEIDRLVQCLVSLAVRSPMNREASVSLADQLRGGQLPPRERAAIMGLNMRRQQQSIVEDVGLRAKFVVFFSPKRDFLFGDGFYHNVQYARPPLRNPTVLAPITPNISVLLTRPQQYMANPRLTTLTLTEEEAEQLNLAVQIYSKNAIYFRQDAPCIDDSFLTGEHRQFADAYNPVSHMIHNLPGVPAFGHSIFGWP